MAADPAAPAVPLDDAPRLIHALAGFDPLIPRKAREALVEMGPPVVPLLVEALQSPDDQVRWEVSKALAEIGRPQAAAALVEALTDHMPGVRWLAAEGLIQAGRDSLDPLLHALLRHSESPWLREGAHHVLSTLGHGQLARLVTPVIRALEGIEPGIGVIVPAAEAIKALRSESRA